MHNQQSVLLVSMPFAGIDIPSIQLATLESYLKQRKISVTSKHLYVNAADIYGIAHYNFLIYPPNDSYTAQLFFIKHVFPKHYQLNKDKIKKYFKNNISKNTTEKKYNLTYEEYQQRTDLLYEYIIKQLDWEKFDIIGFSCNYGQFLPSLAIAKQIKKTNPDKHIVFGGSRTSGKLGKVTLSCFDYIDSIVSGEGEEALYELSLHFSSYEDIPNLIHRKGTTIKSNPSKQSMNLSDSPLPSYESFYQTLCQTSNETQQYHQYYGRLPVEISRGCWWNKCSFCNLNLQYDRYKEKSYDAIQREISTLSDKYGLLSIQLIGNTLPVKDIDSFVTHLYQLNKDHIFIAEARADQLTRQNYTDLKRTGVSILQTGVESLSKQYLKKMNKGVGVIENLAALKYCQEQSIENHYNLISNYPNEDETDFKQTKQTVDIIKSYIDPPTLCNLRIVYGSTVYHHYDQYGIDTLTYTSIDRLFFPASILHKNISFVYDYKPKTKKADHPWESLIKEWKQQRNHRQQQALKTKQDIDRYIFYFIDGSTFLKIYDKRKEDQINIYILDSLERHIFLSCLNVQHFNDLKEQFPESTDQDLKKILDSFVQIGIMYEEDKQYLSLPLQYRIVKGIRKNDNDNTKQLFEQNIITLKNK